ncbi:hypothetical protein K438DRAFT_1835535 [Mycena galopus ATCC 62051]|nr:hypothetical protein K438DRAFT_1835535 [Mycena galopus ATCC 62051]
MHIGDPSMEESRPGLFRVGPTGLVLLMRLLRQCAGSTSTNAGTPPWGGHTDKFPNRSSSSRRHGSPF